MIYNIVPYRSVLFYDYCLSGNEEKTEDFPSKTRNFEFGLSPFGPKSTLRKAKW